MALIAALLMTSGFTFALTNDCGTNQFGMNFICISAGKFKMGSPVNEPDRYPFDQEPREITISKSFEMQTTEVTQEQWESITGVNPAHFKGNKKHPVETVSWDDAQEFISKINVIDKEYTYRLPTEAEWEYSVRAGTDTAFFWGKDKSDAFNYAWIVNPGETGVGGTTVVNSTHEVATKSPNPWGLYDMGGNVWEWVQDAYQRDLSTLPSTDPMVVGDANSFRVLRGGGFGEYPQHTRSALRYRDGHGSRNVNVGLRLVRTKKIK